MSLEMVKEIKEVEARADVLKKEAAAQAKQIAIDSQKTCSALMEAAKGKARVYLTEALKRADTFADKEGEARRAKMASHCEEIRNKAMIRFEEAVEIVVGRIVEG